jgi:hypothetical protein
VIGMSPPGFSRAIARLEERLKIQLFNRATRSVYASLRRVRRPDAPGLTVLFRSASQQTPTQSNAYSRCPISCPQLHPPFRCITFT